MAQTIRTFSSTMSQDAQVIERSDIRKLKFFHTGDHDPYETFDPIGESDTNIAMPNGVPAHTNDDATKSLVIEYDGSAPVWKHRVSGRIIEDDGHGGTTSTDIQSMTINLNASTYGMMRIRPAGGSQTMLGFFVPDYTLGANADKALVVNEYGNGLEWKTPPTAIKYFIIGADASDIVAALDDGFFPIVVDRHTGGGGYRTDFTYYLGFRDWHNNDLVFIKSDGSEGYTVSGSTWTKFDTRGDELRVLDNSNVESFDTPGTYSCDVTEGEVLNIELDANGSVRINIGTQSEKTIHSLISVASGSHSCAYFTMVWTDESLTNRVIEIDTSVADTWLFDVTIRRVQYNNQWYSVARILDLPCGYRPQANQLQVSDTSWIGRC